MPSPQPGPAAVGRRKGASEPDPVAQEIQSRLTDLRNTEVNPEDAVEQGLLAILESTEIDAGAICLFDPRQQVLRLAAERGLSDQGCKSLRHIRRGFAGAWDMPLQSLTNRRVYLIENAAQNRYVPPLIDEPDKMRTVLCLPLLAGSSPVGSLILISTGHKPFADQDVIRLEGPGRELAAIIETARARARQSERPPAAAVPTESYRGSAYGSGTMVADEATRRAIAENMLGQRFDPENELMRARQLANDWERKHQELAGELAAATAREQRLRDELTTAAERLQDLSKNAPAKSGNKDQAAQLAQNARLQASLAEAEAIAARERMRATEVERKLTEMAELLSASAAREDELRKLLEAGDTTDPARRTEFIDQSLELARLNARLAEAETALAAGRGRSDGAAEASAESTAEAVTAAVEQALEQATADFEARRQALQTTFDTDRGRLETKLAEMDAALAEARRAAQASDAERTTLRADLAATRAREEALGEELRAAAEQHQRFVSEVEQRERQRDTTRSTELAQVQAELREAQETAQRARDRLGAIEQKHQEVAGQLAASSTREQTLREELENASRGQQARVLELEALLEHERAVVLDWQRKHATLDEAHRGATERERQRLAEALRKEEEAAARAAAAEALSTREEARAAEHASELQELAARLREVEAAAARDATRAQESEQRCGTIGAQLEDALTRHAEMERELQELRSQLAARSANAAATVAEQAAENESLAARVAAAEAARAAAEQTIGSWAQRHDALAAELEAAVARADELARALEAVRTDNARDRVEAEGARAAALAEAETTRAGLTEAQQKAAEAQQKADALAGELVTLRAAIAELEQQVDGLARERDTLRVELETARSTPAPAAASAPPAPKPIERVAPPPAGAAPARPAPPRPSPRVAAAAAVKGTVKRIVVLDDPALWQNVQLHGVETLVLAPGVDLAARVREAEGDRVLVNLAARGSFDTVLAARAAGLQAPFCGCLVPPGLQRGLHLGFVEVAHTPLDPDDVVAQLGPFASRGTRVLTAGADADAFISLRQALSRQGMSVSMAWDGKQASDLLQMVRPEIVVVDLDIPPRGGVALLVELTAAQALPMLVLIPGRQDVGKRSAAELADSALAARLLPPDRLLDEVRRSGQPQS